jgi:hypothetical protein
LSQWNYDWSDRFESQKYLFVSKLPRRRYPVLAIRPVDHGKRVTRRPADAPTLRQPNQRLLWDVLVSSAVLLVFMRVEGKLLRMRFRWLPIVGLCAVGVSLALPLFLFLRERALEENSTSVQRGVAPAK